MARAPLTRSEGFLLVEKAYAEKLGQKRNNHPFFKTVIPVGTPNKTKMKNNPGSKSGM